MSAHFWTVQKVAENKVIVLFNGDDTSHESIASVDVQPFDCDERDEFVQVLLTPAK